jgi:deoxyribonuclease-4
MQDEHFDDIQLILETPNTERWPEEIKMLEEMTV